VVKEGELAGRWILDGAHNPDGAHALVRALASETIGAVVFGALADKAWREMLGAIATIDAPRFYATPVGRTPAEPELLASEAPGTPATSLAEALVAARRRAGEAPVIVCGSLYLVGEARSRLLGLAPDPIVAL
jgi:dihydrofolate synthase/folylpolyglutamate synthase